MAITIGPVVDITNDTVTTNEDAPISFNVLTGTNGASADSFENAGARVTSVNQPPVGQGTVTFSADGTLLFTPAANFNGVAVFTYTVTSSGVTETATVTVNVTAVNDPPVNTVPGAQITNEDSPLPITGVSVTDVDSGNLTTTLSVANGSIVVTGGGGATVTGNGSGTVVLNGTAAQINAALAGLTYSNTADRSGSDTLTVATSDGVATDTDTVAITVNAVADITDDTVTTAEDTPISFNVLTGSNGATADSFENAGAVVSSVTQPANGTVSFTAAGVLTFTPAANFNGITSFTYTVTSGGVTETATVTVNVTAVNDAPVNTVQTPQTASEDTPLSIPSISVADVDSTSLTTTLTVAHGSIAVAATGGAAVTGNGTGAVVITGTAAQVNAALAGLVYTNTPDYSGADALTVMSSDGSVTDTDVIAITVTPVADITNDTVTTAEDTPISFNVLTGTNGATADSFENAGALVTSVTQPANGTVSFTAAGVMSFTPAANFNGSTTFTYTVTSGGVTETATVTVNVTAVNDAPVNTVPGAQSATEDTPKAITGVSVADIDSANLTTTLTIANGTATVTAGGGATITGNGSASVAISGTAAQINAALAGLTYIGTADYNGPATVGISTADGSSIDTDSIAILVGPVVDITNDTVATAENIPILFNVLTGTNGATADSFENPGAFVSGVTQPLNGTVTFTAAGVMTFTPAANFNGTTSFIYTVTSGGATETATVTINVGAVNDPPVPVADGFVVAEDTSVRIDVLGNDTDPENDALAVTQINGQPIAIGAPVTVAGGQVSLNADGSINFTPNVNFNGVVSFSYTVADPAGASATALVTGVVTPVNDAPVASAPPRVTAEDTPVSGQIVGTDADGDTLTFVLRDAPAHGSVTVNADGSYRYTPAPNYNGPDSFTVIVSDGNGGLSAVTVGIVVTPVNDAPVAVGDSASTAAQTPVTLNVLGNDSDPEADPLRVGAVDGTPIKVGVPVAVTGGQVSLNVDGTLTFTPAPGFSGVASFSYTAIDPAGATGTATVSVNVAPPVLPPLVVAPIATSGTADIQQLLAIGNAGFPAGWTPLHDTDLKGYPGRSMQVPPHIIEAVNAIKSLNGLPSLSVAMPVREAVNGMRSLGGVSSLDVDSPILDLVEYLERKYPVIDSVDALFSREGDSDVFAAIHGGDALVLPDLDVTSTPIAQLLFSEQLALQAAPGAADLQALVAALRTRTPAENTH